MRSHVEVFKNKGEILLKIVSALEGTVKKSMNCILDDYCYYKKNHLQVCSFISCYHPGEKTDDLKESELKKEREGGLNPEADQGGAGVEDDQEKMHDESLEARNQPGAARDDIVCIDNPGTARIKTLPKVEEMTENPAEEPQEGLQSDPVTLETSKIAQTNEIEDLSSSAQRIREKLDELIVFIIDCEQELENKVQKLLKPGFIQKLIKYAQDQYNELSFVYSYLLKMMLTSAKEDYQGQLTVLTNPAIIEYKTCFLMQAFRTLLLEQIGSNLTDVLDRLEGRLRAERGDFEKELAWFKHGVEKILEEEGGHDDIKVENLINFEAHLDQLDPSNLIGEHLKEYILKKGQSKDSGQKEAEDAKKEIDKIGLDTLGSFIKDYRITCDAESQLIQSHLVCKIALNNGQGNKTQASARPENDEEVGAPLKEHAKLTNRCYLCLDVFGFLTLIYDTNVFVKDQLSPNSVINYIKNCIGFYNGIEKMELKYKPPHLYVSYAQSKAVVLELEVSRKSNVDSFFTTFSLLKQSRLNYLKYLEGLRK